MTYNTLALFHSTTFICSDYHKILQIYHFGGIFVFVFRDGRRKVSIYSQYYPCNHDFSRLMQLTSPIRV